MRFAISKPKFGLCRIECICVCTDCPLSCLLYFVCRWPTHPPWTVSMAQAALCDITPQTRIPTLLIVFCVHVLLLVGRCEFRPNAVPMPVPQSQMAEGPAGGASAMETTWGGDAAHHQWGPPFTHMHSRGRRGHARLGGSSSGPCARAGSNTGGGIPPVGHHSSVLRHRYVSGSTASGERRTYKAADQETAHSTGGQRDEVRKDTRESRCYKTAFPCLRSGVHSQTGARDHGLGASQTKPNQTPPPPPVMLSRSPSSKGKMP